MLAVPGCNGNREEVSTAPASPEHYQSLESFGITQERGHHVHSGSEQWEAHACRGPGQACAYLGPGWWAQKSQRHQAAQQTQEVLFCCTGQGSNLMPVVAELPLAQPGGALPREGVTGPCVHEVWA